MIGPSNRAPYRRMRPIAVKGVKQRYDSIQPVEGATKLMSLVAPPGGTANV